MLIVSNALRIKSTKQVFPTANRNNYSWRCEGMELEGNGCCVCLDFWTPADATATAKPSAGAEAPTFMRYPLSCCLSGNTS